MPAGDVYTATGVKVFIGPVTAASVNTASAFAALSYVEIGLAENLGEFGDEAAAVTFRALADRRVRKAKGGKDAGMMSVTVGDDPADTGQQALIAAEAADSNYAFKVLYPNRLNPTGTDGADYFRGLVMSKRRQVNNADNVVRRVFNVAINSAIYEIAPTSGA